LGRISEEEIIIYRCTEKGQNTMGTLIGLMKAAIGAVLLNRTVRNAFLSGATRSLNYILQPSTSSRIIAFISGLIKFASGSQPNLLQTLLKGAFGLVLLKLTRRSRILELAAFSGLGAFLLDILRANGGRQNENKKRQTDRIIDIDEYIVIEDSQ
jgi:hypothetical protein